MDEQLPPLPQEFMQHWRSAPFESMPLYTADQMRAYAAAAVAAERERCAKACEQYGDKVLDDSGMAEACALIIRGHR